MIVPGGDTFYTSSSLLKIGVLDWVTMDVAPPYQTAGGGDQFRVCEPRISSGAGGFSEIVLQEVGSEQPLAGQAWELELSISLGSLSVLIPSQFLQGSAMCSFHQSAAGLPQLKLD
jgi:hypothetical protein